MMRTSVVVRDSTCDYLLLMEKSRFLKNNNFMLLGYEQSRVAVNLKRMFYS